MVEEVHSVSPSFSTSSSFPPSLPYSLRPAYARRQRRHAIRSRQVTGQCSYCLDLFSVDLYYRNGTLYVSETPRVKQVYGARGEPAQLIHRPDYCNAKVNLYGSLEGFLPD